MEFFPLHKNVKETRLSKLKIIKFLFAVTTVTYVLISERNNFAWQNNYDYIDNGLQAYTVGGRAVIY